MGEARPQGLALHGSRASPIRYITVSWDGKGEFSPSPVLAARLLGATYSRPAVAESGFRTRAPLNTHAISRVYSHCSAGWLRQAISTNAVGRLWRLLTFIRALNTSQAIVAGGGSPHVNVRSICCPRADRRIIIPGRGINHICRRRLRVHDYDLNVGGVPLAN